ncbi:hypothetical protein UA75_06620 [Actinoalloteichus sp. GBA129-24]|uniref:Transmembrane protein n=1 Tax=Actinoalloteichus fjordicus TaxID=1612552 RepID=A0AAC9LB25_9PSEU|nr:hypothetical protein UA74_06620 [Actinoalloteichus fjordicus]APU19347.1 hypothetical protein UA75_06620 [Actinoalloteichus sp. GBA129-24]
MRRPRLFLWLGLGGLLATGILLLYVNLLFVVAAAMSCAEPANCSVPRNVFLLYGPTATLLAGLITGGIGGERAIRAGRPVVGWVGWPWLFYAAVFLVALMVSL